MGLSQFWDEQGLKGVQALIYGLWQKQNWKVFACNSRKKHILSDVQEWIFEAVANALLHLWTWR